MKEDKKRWYHFNVFHGYFLLCFVIYLALNYSTSRIGIIGAMDEEIALIVGQLQDRRVEEHAGLSFHLGTLGGKDVVVVQSGVGKVNASVAAQLLISEFDVNGIVNVGVAGALHDSLSIGDIVIVTGAIHHDFNTTAFGDEPGEVYGMGIIEFVPDSLLTAQVHSAVSHFNFQDVLGRSPRVYSGIILSGDQFIADPIKAVELKKQFSGDCIDMESAAIAQVCHVNGIPWVIVRAISDKAGSGAQIDFEAFLKEAAGNSQKTVNAIVSLWQLE